MEGADTAAEISQAIEDDNPGRFEGSSACSARATEI